MYLCMSALLLPDMVGIKQHGKSDDETGKKDHGVKDAFDFLDGQGFELSDRDGRDTIEPLLGY